MRSFVPCLFSATALIAPAASAADLLVPSQHPTVQGAINAAGAGDVILISPGTYNESLNLLGKAITLRGSGALSTTITAMNLNSRALTFTSGETAATVIEQLTIAAGYEANAGGGGVLITNSSPTFRDCRFVDHFSNFNGGCVAVSGPSAAPHFSRCRFHNNVTYGNGGAMYLASGATVVDNCIFTFNFGGGGGIAVAGGTPFIASCKFLGNEAGFVNGGGVFVSGGTPTVVNCLFAANHSYVNGGGIACSGSGVNADFIHCTIVDNSAASGSAMYTANNASVEVINTLAWNNQVSTFSGPTAPIVSYSNIQGGFPGVGNINSPPMFIDADGPDNSPQSYDDNNYRLKSQSAGVDAGLSGLALFDVPDLDRDGNTAEPLPLDLDNHRRLVDDAATPNTGQGGPTPADIGAYEYRLPCPGDIIPNDTYQFGNDRVDIDDLLEVITRWGEASVEHQINVVNTAFVPSLVNAKSGDRVRFQFMASGHTATSGSQCTPDGRFNATTTFIYTIPITFNGNLPFFCINHCGGMSGVVMTMPFGPDVTGNAVVNVDDMLEVINRWGECP